MPRRTRRSTTSRCPGRAAAAYAAAATTRRCGTGSRTRLHGRAGEAGAAKERRGSSPKRSSRPRRSRFWGYKHRVCPTTSWPMQRSRRSRPPSPSSGRPAARALLQALACDVRRMLSYSSLSLLASCLRVLRLRGPGRALAFYEGRIRLVNLIAIVLLVALFPGLVAAIVAGVLVHPLFFLLLILLILVLPALRAARR